MLNTYLLLAIAVASNLLTVFCMKLSQGMTRPWPTFVVVITILLTQWLVADTMERGVDVAYVVTVVVVAVMIGSGIIGLYFGERLSLLKGFGYIVAIIGVIIANTAKA